MTIWVTFSFITVVLPYWSETVKETTPFCVMDTALSWLVTKICLDESSAFCTSSVTPEERTTLPLLSRSVPNLLLPSVPN
ncbi:hypothetical protein D3C73_1266250 [compost metagenome]